MTLKELANRILKLPAVQQEQPALVGDIDFSEILDIRTIQHLYPDGEEPSLPLDQLVLVIDPDTDQQDDPDEEFDDEWSNEEHEKPPRLILPPDYNPPDLPNVKRPKPRNQ